MSPPIISAVEVFFQLILGLVEIVMTDIGPKRGEKFQEWWSARSFVNKLRTVISWAVIVFGAIIVLVLPIWLVIAFSWWLLIGTA